MADGSAGTQIGRYLVARELGRGGMGIVYEASDPAIGRRVAIKVINLQFLTGDGEAQVLRDRLFREAQSAGSLLHPSIVVVYDVGEDHQMAFIAMEFVDGPSLQQLQQSGERLEPARVVEILRQVAAALDYAHENGIVHRDIKPANIMLHRGAQVKIADFGIAKITTAPKYTVTGLVMGTPAYMSPEQIEGRDVDGRSDQFALAVVAFELLTGATPFHGRSFATMVHDIVRGERPSAHAANPSLPTALDVVLARGMATAAQDRFANCTEFVEELSNALDDGLNASLPCRVDPQASQTVAAAPVRIPTLAQAPPAATLPAPAQTAMVPPAVPSSSSRGLWPALAGLMVVVLALGGAIAYKLWPLLSNRAEQQAQPAQPASTLAGGTASGTPAVIPQAQSPVPEGKQAASDMPAPSSGRRAAAVPSKVADAKEPASSPVKKKTAVPQPAENVPRPSAVKTVVVQSTQAWTDTGIDLSAGDVVSIAASGEIRIAADPRLHVQQPGGFFPNCDYANKLFSQKPRAAVPAPDLSCWSLIGRVGARGAVFEVGMKAAVPPKSIGRLYLGVNDDNYSDNSGSWSATVTVEHH